MKPKPIILNANTMNIYGKCPSCNKSWRGKKIPQKDKGLYQIVTHYSTLICSEYSWDHPDHYDGVSEYKCPYCHTRFGRWSGKVLSASETEKRYGRCKKVKLEKRIK